MICELCGGSAGGGGDRYSRRPARFCSDTCRNRWHSLQSPRKVTTDWKWAEVLRLRALLDERGVDWRPSG